MPLLILSALPGALPHHGPLTLTHSPPALPIQPGLDTRPGLLYFLGSMEIHLSLLYSQCVEVISLWRWGIFKSMLPDERVSSRQKKEKMKQSLLWMEYYLWLNNLCKEKAIINHCHGNLLSFAHWIYMQNSLSKILIFSCRGKRKAEADDKRLNRALPNVRNVSFE